MIVKPEKKIAKAIWDDLLKARTGKEAGKEAGKETKEKNRN